MESEKCEKPFTLYRRQESITSSSSSALRQKQFLRKISELGISKSILPNAKMIRRPSIGIEAMAIASTSINTVFSNHCSNAAEQSKKSNIFVTLNC